MLIVLVLALFPIVYLFNPRLAMVALVLAIVALYLKRTTTGRVRRPEAPKPQTPWKDPWGTGSSA